MKLHKNMSNGRTITVKKRPRNGSSANDSKPEGERFEDDEVRRAYEKTVRRFGESLKRLTD